MMYCPPLPQDMCPVRQLANVTAGLRWPANTARVAANAVNAGHLPSCCKAAVGTSCLLALAQRHRPDTAGCTRYMNIMHAPVSVVL